MTNRFDKTIKRPSKDPSRSLSSPAFDDIFLPLPPLTGGEGFELEIYAVFMRQLRLNPNSRAVIKILAAIEFTADYLDFSYGFVARVLADMGLRAPRHAFPEEYLDLVERSFLRLGADIGGPCASTIDMIRFWTDIGDAAFIPDLEPVHQAEQLMTT